MKRRLRGRKPKRLLQSPGRNNERGEGLMGNMIIDYVEIDLMKHEVDSLNRLYKERIDDYTGIVGKIADVPTPRSYLSASNYFISKKINEYQDKTEKAGAFYGKMDAFMAETKDADKRVANRITTSTDVFMKANNISIGPLTVIGIVLKDIFVAEVSILDAVTGGYVVRAMEDFIVDTTTAIVDWYKNGGYKIVGIVVLTVVVIAAVAAVVLVAVSMGIPLLALAIMGGIGIAVGLSSQLASDIITSVAVGKWSPSSWQTYVGAGVGGLLGGISELAFGPMAASAVSSGASTLIGESLEDFTDGEQHSASQIFVDVIKDVTIGVALSKVKVEIPGINKDKGNMEAVFEGGITRIVNGTAKRMSFSVMWKGYVEQMTANADEIVEKAGEQVYKHVKEEMKEEEYRRTATHIYMNTTLQPAY